GKAAGEAEEEEQGGLGHGVAVGGGGVADGEAAGARGVEVDALVADGGLLDEAQARGGVQGGGAEGHVRREGHRGGGGGRGGMAGGPSSARMKRVARAWVLGPRQATAWWATSGSARRAGSSRTARSSSSRASEHHSLAWKAPARAARAWPSRGLRWRAKR